ncbi:MAG: HTH-type transcriptional repressor YvoA [Pseudomonadota bacterium]
MAGKPRYLELAEDLRARILSGALPANDQFPTENALCAEHGVSRFTVREALRRLQNEGLITRKRGSGTLVQPAAARGGALHQPLSNVGELLQYARETEVRFSAMGLATLPAPYAEQIADECGGKWFYFRGLRSQTSDALPIALTEAFVAERLRDAVARIDLKGDTLFRQIELETGQETGRVTQDIQATAADAEVADALAIDVGAPVLRILRCYYDRKGRLFEISASHHPGERFAYAMHIDIDH